MNNRKVGMFTGWKEVYSFTAGQILKGKGFKVSVICISLLIFGLVVFVCNLGNIIDDDSDENVISTIEDIVDNEGEYSFETIKEVYLYNDTEFSDSKVKDLFYVTEKNFKDIKEIKMVKELSSDIIANKDAVIIKYTLDTIHSSEGDGKYNLFILTSSDSNVDKEEVEAFGLLVVNDIKYSVFYTGNIDAKNFKQISSGTFSNTVSSDSEAVSMAEFAIKLIVPMLICLVVYMMILLHGQSITNAIIADKSSKLMEMLLTSVKPYAIIFGKIFGTASIAILQMVIWIVSGFLGYFVGDIVNKEVFGNEETVISSILKIFDGEVGANLFNMKNAAIAIVAVAIGFFFYCIIAGFAGSVISKVEDVTVANTMYNIPVVIGFLGAYFILLASAEGETSIINIILRYFPLTSVYMIPSELLTGVISLSEAAISIGVLIISCFVLVFITGRIYKGKIFNKK